MSEVIVEIQGRLQPLTEAILLAEYACGAVTAIVFYDYFLTLNLEVQVMWRRTARLPTFIFLVNRYSCIAFCIALVYPVGTKADFILQVIFGSLLSLSLALFFALRTSAIWDCSAAVFAAVLLAYIPGFTLNLCVLLLRDVPVTVTVTISALVPSCFLIFDAFVLGLSLVKIRKLYGSLGIVDTGNLHTFVLEHGIIYFVLLVTVNIVQIFLTVIWNTPMNTGFIIPLSSILVTRFMLHLRERASPYTDKPRTKPERQSLLSRPSITGNLGELLMTDEYPSASRP